jgi:hypothetical protein
VETKKVGGLFVAGMVEKRFADSDLEKQIGVSVSTEQYNHTQTHYNVQLCSRSQCMCTAEICLIMVKRIREWEKRLRERRENYGMKNFIDSLTDTTLYTILTDTCYTFCLYRQLTLTNCHN